MGDIAIDDYLLDPFSNSCENKWLSHNLGSTLLGILADCGVIRKEEIVPINFT